MFQYFKKPGEALADQDGRTNPQPSRLFQTLSKLACQWVFMRNVKYDIQLQSDVASFKGLYPVSFPSLHNILGNFVIEDLSQKGYQSNSQYQHVISSLIKLPISVPREGAGMKDGCYLRHVLPTQWPLGKWSQSIALEDYSDTVSPSAGFMQ